MHRTHIVRAAAKVLYSPLLSDHFYYGNVKRFGMFICLNYMRVVLEVSVIYLHYFIRVFIHDVIHTVRNMNVNYAGIRNGCIISPMIVAVIVVTPTLSAVTPPFALTLATEGLSEVQVTEGALVVACKV